MHKKCILGKSQATPEEAPPCNCRKKMDCQLDGQGSRYEYAKFYVGLCETEFKTRWNNHKQSFKNRKLKNATELSKYI